MVKYKYKYTGKGITTFFIDRERITLGGEEAPNLPNTIELAGKVDREGLEFIGEVEEKEEEPKKRKKKSKEEISIKLNGGG